MGLIDCFDKWPWTKEDCGASVDKSMGLVIFILSILFGGLATMIVGCMDKNVMKECMLCGLVQWLTGGCCVGWLWSLHTGYGIWQKNQ